jgi:hypothetical protein
MGIKRQSKRACAQPVDAVENGETLYSNEPDKTRRLPRLRFTRYPVVTKTVARHYQSQKGTRSWIANVEADSPGIISP